MTRISSHPLNEGGIFEIKVLDGTASRTFVTKRLLFDAGAERVRGRGTRVWEVYEKGDAYMVSRALKDCWIEHGRRFEGATYRMIEEAIALLPQESQHARKHLLSILCHGDIDQDDTVLIRRNHTIPPDCPTIDLTERDGRIFDPIPLSDRLQPLGHLNQLIQDLGTDVQVYPRKHYRILYKEVGVTVKDIMDMGDVFKALEGAARGIYFCVSPSSSQI